METCDFYEEVVFEAAPEKVYEILLNEDLHSSFTDSDVEIDPVEGGRFTAYNGYIKGENLELVKGKKIVQRWQAAEEEWEETHFSTVKFELEPFQDGTLLKFTHSAVPEPCATSIFAGWKQYYWDPMKEYFEEL